MPRVRFQDDLLHNLRLPHCPFDGVPLTEPDGMWAAPPDRGVLQCHPAALDGCARLFLVDAHGHLHGWRMPNEPDWRDMEIKQITDPQGYTWTWDDTMQRWTTKFAPGVVGGCKYEELILSGDATRDLLAVYQAEPNQTRVYIEAGKQADLQAELKQAMESPTVRRDRRPE